MSDPGWRLELSRLGRYAGALGPGVVGRLAAMEAGRVVGRLAVREEGRGGSYPPWRLRACRVAAPPGGYGGRAGVAPGRP